MVKFKSIAVAAVAIALGGSAGTSYAYTLQDAQNDLYGVQISAERQKMILAGEEHWDKEALMLYLEPTQWRWDITKKLALDMTADYGDVHRVVGKMIDDKLDIITYNTNGDITRLRYNIFNYLLGTKISMESLNLLVEITNNSRLNQLQKRILVTMLGHGYEAEKVRFMMNNPPPVSSSQINPK
jgi:hypothetical protein